ncbi:MAG: RNB domain-containing ribonuclease [Treponema sp.]|nr:RNB domain-containing ribonuclease [Treponema sp.]
MIRGSLAVFKNKPALVKEHDQDKIAIVLSDGAQIKVREKDIEIIHPGPVNNLKEIDEAASMESSGGAIREAWELLLAEQSPVSLGELAGLAFGEYSPASAWAAFRLLQDGLYFTGTVGAVQSRQRDQVEAGEKKREEKARETREREMFLERLRNRSPFLGIGDWGSGTGEKHHPPVPIPQSLFPSPQSPVPLDDRRFIQDIEALAYGRSAKSRTMKDIGLGETPEEAHALLVECGFWPKEANPHPARFGVSLLPAQSVPGPPPEESRRDLSHMAAFAIDSPWSHDPDDAVSLEVEGGRQVLYVHVADPAASIGSDSPCEREARDRGATLYIPEGSIRMIAEEALPLFALGFTEGKNASPAERSPALTFKMALDSSGEISETEIFPSIVKVSRLTYREADELMAGAGGDGAGALRDLFALAQRNAARRSASGAISIDMPETHISLNPPPRPDRAEVPLRNQGQVTIEPVVRYRSMELVRECMLLAGEGAGTWAMQRNLPFPYVTQETGETPDEIFPGLAGAYQLRRCMRARTMSVKPGLHWGLGLETYTQVTSPLRRHGDLLAHIQIRALLRGDSPLSTEEVLERISAGEIAAAAVARAERASRHHWTMVYLSGKKDSVWDAVALEQKGNRWAAIIPALALETQVPLRREVAPNDPLRLVLKSANIPRGEAAFVPGEGIL